MLAVVSIAKIHIVLKMRRFATYHCYQSVFDFFGFRTFYTNLPILMVPEGVNC